MSTGFTPEPYAPEASDPAVEATQNYAEHFIEPSRGWSEWILPTCLFAATFLSTTFAGLVYNGFGDRPFLLVVFMALRNPAILLHGLPFSFPFLTILLAHELGHFLACKYYRIRCTPPFFIPFPISIAGTLGAFIRIKSPFQNKRALFDVGVAGPLAGFVFLLPALAIGIAHSQIISKESVEGGLRFGEPLIFQWVAKVILGYSPSSQDMIAHPIAMAAWFGLFATCLNLLPIWQLDGGHLAYAILGPGAQRKLSVLLTVALILVSFLSWPIPSLPYMVSGVLLLILGSRFRFYHPPTMADDEPIGPGRVAIAVLSLVILAVSFTPVPFSLT